MVDAVRARIFEPFFTTKDVDKGTGLGLATVFGIVKQSSGAIAVDSIPGHGTTFRIYWPRIDAVVAVAAETRFVPVRGSSTMLVVEDDAQLRKVLRRYLTSWGYTLLEAACGADALELARGHDGPIDLLLTDLVMPRGIDGRTLSRQILADRPTIKVVFMSGYTEHPALHSAAIGPGDVFVQKPFTSRTLHETLHRALVEPVTASP
jgi:CheY-like chemotaxis protein